ncbi:MAG: hypothetical protein AAB932_03750 [Patescibacteria group bacterium]
MTKKQIYQRISNISLDEMKVLHVACRPPEKSDAVLTVEIAGKTWYCERPKYFWSKFDQSFVGGGYTKEQKLLYPDETDVLGLFDKRGLWWAREEMSSFGLLQYYLKNPSTYLRMMTRHTYEVKEIVAVLKRISPTLTDPNYFIRNLSIFIGLYERMYWAFGSIFMLFDELAWQWRTLLLKYLPKENVNIYFPMFLSGEATKEALKKDYLKERGRLEYSPTRGVLYAMGIKARRFYVQPHFFHDYSEDNHILDLVIENGISDNDLNKFISFRMMMPLGFQINEEAQYVETAGLSAHLGILMRSISENLDKPMSEFQQMGVQKIIHMISK